MIGQLFFMKKNPKWGESKSMIRGGYFDIDEYNTYGFDGGLLEDTLGAVKAALDAANVSEEIVVYLEYKGKTIASRDIQNPDC